MPLSTRDLPRSSASGDATLNPPVFAAWMNNVRAAVTLVLLTFAVYSITASFGFLNWDDGHYVVHNELIRSWHPANLYRIATEVVARNYAPVTILTLLVEHSFFGDWAGGYHLVNVAFHAVNAVLVLVLIQQLTGSRGLAWFTAAMFAVHPVQVESVAWVSSVKSVISSSFMLASLVCWLHPNRTTKQEMWGIAWLGLALLSKASAVTLPGIVIAYDVLVAKKEFKESCLRQLVPMFCCLTLLLTTMSSQVAYGGGVRDHLVLNKFQLMAVDTTLLWRYCGMLIWPSDLCVLYDPPFRDIELLIFLATFAWGLVAWLAWSLRDRAPLVPLAAAAWILLLLPVLNLFPLTTLMNDRYLYLPLVPFFAVLGGGMQWTWGRLASTRFSTERGRRGSWFANEERLALANAANAVHAVDPPPSPLPKKGGGAVCVAAADSPPHYGRWFGHAATFAAVTVAAMSTVQYLPVWKSPESLWSHARATTPTLAVVHIQWALTMERIGDHEAAAAALEFAKLHCHPDEHDQQRIERMLAGN